MVKDHAETPGPQLPWAGKKVQTTSVEAELSHLWRMSADNMRTSQNVNVRTSILNLVICAPDVISAHRASMLIRDLSSTHIARVILLVLDTHGMPSSINTWVTLRSFPIISDMMRHSFEQITVLASGAAVYDADHIAQALLKNDLPAYVWWLGNLPTDRSILRRIGDISTRVIVDSASFTKPTESIQALSSLIQTAPGCAISDLNWARITPWRELIAQFFDVTEYKPYLLGINDIAIEHAMVSSEEAEKTPPNPTQALLLAAWLKTRLGWRAAPDDQYEEYHPERGIYTWHMARPTGKLTKTLPEVDPASQDIADPTRGRISLHPRVQTDSAVGSVCFVRLDSVHGNQHATFSINREDDQHVTTSVELEESTSPAHTVSVAAAQNASNLLHNELEIMGRDLLYEETLHEVFDLLAE